MILRAQAKPRVRCAIYTRKSAEEGLEQEFNSLDAQRESAEAFIQSQAREGWTRLPEPYDDGGYTGGDMDRPALRRLLADVEAGKIDCVVLYKVDRLSRSLLDFAKIIDRFEKHDVCFVSVTQQFNTATSTGRLLLNILLSFAQFERELIGERTRDKMAAARRKGKWTGGSPILGYDPTGGKLLVNSAEARRVREIFALYLQRQTLGPVIAELNRRGWTTKRWTTKGGKRRGGFAFNASNLRLLLTNPTYAGRVRSRDGLHEGEHEAIVEPDAFDRAQASLRRPGAKGRTRRQATALLNGLLRCAACGCAMSHCYSCKGNYRYRYYVCGKAAKLGWKHCPSPSVPAAEMERLVVDRIRAVGRDPGLVRRTLEPNGRGIDEQVGRLQVELEKLRRRMGREDAEVRPLITKRDQPSLARLVELNQRLGEAERRETELRQEIADLQAGRIDEPELAAALTDFDRRWQRGSACERERMLGRLIERIDYQDGDAAISFRPAGVKTLAVQGARAPSDGQRQ